MRITENQLRSIIRSVIVEEQNKTSYQVNEGFMQDISDKIRLSVVGIALLVASGCNVQNMSVDTDRPAVEQGDAYISVLKDKKALYKEYFQAKDRGDTAKMKELKRYIDICDKNLEHFAGISN